MLFTKGNNDHGFTKEAEKHGLQKKTIIMVSEYMTTMVPQLNYYTLQCIHIFRALF